MGFGRGRWKRKGVKPLVESAPVLDVRQLLRAGALAPGTISFISTGETRLMATAEPSRLVFRYPGGHTDAIPLKWVPCGLGGQRPVAHCPGCGRGAIKFYLVQSRFRCRRCHGLQYLTTRLDDMTSARVRLGRARQKLGEDGLSGFLEPAPERPAGMWVRKYLNLLNRFDDAQEIAMVEMARRLERIVGMR